MVEQRTPATLQVKTLIVIYYQADLQYVSMITSVPYVSMIILCNNYFTAVLT